MRKKRRKIAADNRGTTLVEMIVSFVLISLFMVAATKVIANTVMIYYQAKGISTGMQVSGIVNTKLTGVIEGALAAPLVTDEAPGGGVTPYMLLKKEGLEMTDHLGNHTLIRAIDPDDTAADKPQYMEIYYYPTSEDDDGDPTTPPVVPEYDTTWRFGSKAYMGYYVKELRFEKAGEDYEKNIIKMTLVLDSPRYGEYATTSYIECYNFKGTDADLIVAQTGP